MATLPCRAQPRFTQVASACIRPESLLAYQTCASLSVRSLAPSQACLSQCHNSDSSQMLALERTDDLMVSPWRVNMRSVLSGAGDAVPSSGVECQFERQPRSWRMLQGDPQILTSLMEKDMVSSRTLGPAFSLRALWYLHPSIF